MEEESAHCTRAWALCRALSKEVGQDAMPDTLNDRLTLCQWSLKGRQQCAICTDHASSRAPSYTVLHALAAMIEWGRIGDITPSGEPCLGQQR